MWMLTGVTPITQPCWCIRADEPLPTCTTHDQRQHEAGLHGTFPTGSRQATRLRRQYFHAVLRQEPAYFDVHATTGELLQGLNEDTSAIQLAIGEKVPAACWTVSAFPHTQQPGSLSSDLPWVSCRWATLWTRSSLSA